MAKKSTEELPPIEDYENLVKQMEEAGESFLKLADGLYVDGKTVSLAVEKIRSIRLVEAIVDEETGASHLHKMYKQAHSYRERALSKFNDAVKSLRKKVFLYLTTNEDAEAPKGVYLRGDGYDVEVEDFDAVPDEWKKTVVDEEKIKDIAKSMGGVIVIPGIKLTPRQILTIREK